MRRRPRRLDGLLTRLSPARWRESIAGDFEETGGGAVSTLWHGTRLIARLWLEELAIARRATRRRSSMSVMGFELRQAMRSIRTRPAGAWLAVLTLALGIGAVTSVFSVANWLLWRPIPGSHADRMTTIRLERGDATLPLSSPETRLAVEGSRTLEAAAGWAGLDLHVAVPGHDVARVSAEIVSPAFFDVIGVRPSLGRAFVQGEDGVVVISHGFWRRRLGARADVIGMAISVNGAPQTIVGVAPPRFGGAVRSSDAALWAPLTPSSRFLPGFRGDPTSPRVRAFRGMLARLAPGATVAHAQAEIDARKAQILSQLPNAERFLSGRYVVEPGQLAVRVERERLTRVFTLLLGVVGFVLLLTCANVGGLLVARAAARHTELVTRQALGASRARIGLMLLLEAVLLAAGGTAIALAVAWTLGIALEGTTVPRTGTLARIGLDLNVFLVAAGAATLTAILAGLAPMLAAGRRDLAGSLLGGNRSTAGPRHRARRTLIGVQIAVAVTLLVGAALLARSMQARRAVDAGLDLDTVTFSIDPGLQGYMPESVAPFYDALLRRLGEIPGVEAVSLSQLPLFGRLATFETSIRPAGAPESANVDTELAGVASGFFDATRIGLVAGRDFHESEWRTPDEARRAVVIVSASLARRLFGGAPAVGRRVAIDSERVPHEIVGVARDAKVRDFLEPARARAYLPFPISPFASVVLRAHAGSDDIIARSREAVSALDPSLPIYDAGTVRAATEREMAEEALVARLVLLFAGLAALLAAVGLYGVVSMQATERRREFGIRVALGARPGQLVAAMTGQAIRIALAGLAAGLLSSIWLTGFLASRLYGVERLDMPSYGAAAAAALALAVVAAAAPARRAGRVDPIIALRH